MAASPRSDSPPRAGADSVQVYVGNLSTDTTRDVLRDAFSTFGRVAFATVKWDREAQRGRGYGFVSFESAADAAAAIRAGTVTVDGRAARVGPARQGQRREGAGGGAFSSGGGASRGRWGDDCDARGGGGHHDRSRRRRTRSRSRSRSSRSRSRSPRRSRSRSGSGGGGGGAHVSAAEEALAAKVAMLEALLERRPRGEEAAARRAAEAESRADSARADAAALGGALRRLTGAAARVSAVREELSRAETALRRAADDAAALAQTVHGAPAAGGRGNGERDDGAHDGAQLAAAPTLAYAAAAAGEAAVPVVPPWPAGWRQVAA